MTSPAQSPPESSFEQFLLELAPQVAAAEAAAAELGDRFRAVQAAHLNQRELGDRLEVVRPELKRARDRARREELQSELKSLQTQLDELDLTLESRLLADYGWNDLFWQAVRFGGLGVAIGWGLKLWAG